MVGHEPATRASVSVFLNGGAGTFPSRRDYAGGPGSVAVASGDLNGDGKPELVPAAASFSRTGAAAGSRPRSNTT
jgi:FG-GAP-like repeat